MTRQPAAGSSRHLFTADQRIFVRFQPTVLFLLLFLGLSTAASLFMGQSVLAAGRTVQIRLRACGGEVSKTSAEVSARGSGDADQGDQRAQMKTAPRTDTLDLDRPKEKTMKQCPVVDLSVLFLSLVLRVLLFCFLSVDLS